MTLISVALSATAFAQMPTCEEVRRVRAFAAARGVDDGLAPLEAEACGQLPRIHRREHTQVRRTLTEEEFQVYVVSPLRRASRWEEVSICRQLSTAVRLTSDQVAQVMSHVGRDNEAACALAFYPRVVDPLAWERVYRPMGSASERTVRDAIASMAY